jgi:hypothetical protein
VSEAPLPLFERASRVFAESLLEKGSAEVEAWRKARSEFEQRNDAAGRTAEGEQSLEMMRVWEGRSPIDRTRPDGDLPGFDQLALAFFEPLVAARGRSSE